MVCLFLCNIVDLQYTVSEYGVCGDLQYGISKSLKSAVELNVFLHI